MDIQDKTKEQLIADLELLQDQNRNLKKQLDSITSYKMLSEPIKHTDLIDFDYFELVFNTSPDIAIISRLRDSKVIKVNDGFIKNTGYSREEALNGTRFNINLWQNPADRELLINEIQKHGAFENIETTMVRKDGTSFRSLVSARLFEFDGEKYVSSISRDITNIKIAENRLKESDANARAILDAVTDPIILLDKHAMIVHNNEAHAKRFGLTQKELTGKYIFEFLSSEIANTRRAIFNQVIETGKSVFSEDFRDGHWNEISYYPLLDENNKTEKVAIYAKDITERKKAEAENERTQKLLEDSQRIGKVGGWELNIDSHELHWTSEMYAIHEVDSTFKPTLDERQNFFTPESLIAIDEAVKRTIKLGEPYDIDVEIITAKGNRKNIRTIGKLDSDNRRVVGYFQDITEQKLAEKEKKASDELFKHIFEYSNAGKSITMPDGQVNTNKAFRDLLGYGSDEFHHINWMQITHPDDIELTFNEINRLKKGEVKQVRFSKRFLHKNGSVIWADLSSTALRNKEGELQCFITTILDITEQKLAEQALKESEEKLRNLFENAPIGIFHSIPAGRFITANPPLAKMLGYSSPEELIELTTDINTQIYAAPKLRVEMLEKLKEIDGWVHHEDVEWRRKDGSLITVDMTGRKVLNTDGSIASLEVFINDITERKQAEQALKESEEKFRFIVDNAIEGIYRTSIDGKALMANRALATMLGYASAEEYLKEINDAAHQLWISPEQRDEYISLLDKQDIIQGYECQMKKKDGTPVWVSTNAKIVRDEAGNKIYSEGFTEEITSRKKVETELKRQNQLFNSLINNLSMGVFMVEAPTGKPLIANKSALRLLGQGILPDASKQNLAEVYKAFKNNTNQPYPVDEMPIVRGMYGEYSQIDDMIVERPDGTKTHLEIFGSPVKDEEENVWASLVSFEDITLRKQAEQALKKSEAELKKSQEELRKFSLYLLKVRENERTKISLEIHDSIAQFLVALKVDMGLYLKKMSNGIDVLKAEEVKTKMEQLVTQVENTLKSSRMIMNDLRPDQLDLLGLVEATEVHLHNFEEIHHIKCNFENTVSELIIKKEQSIVLFRILQESLTNILKHAKANTVSVKLTETNANLIMEISDNGVGFDENCVFQSDSYGVISMREQVKQLDGIFTLTSTIGQGTTVRIEIPYKD